MSEIEARPDRVLTAMVTPFNEDGRLNIDGAEKLSAHLTANGSEGLVLAGTTGESPTLESADQIELFRNVRFANPDTIILGGTGSNYTAHAVEMTRKASELEVLDGLLVVSPYYNRPPQAGIFDYYRQIREATDPDMPIILYNIPVRTGRAVEEDTVRRLFEENIIDGVKDATGETDMAARLHEEFGDEIRIYSGDDGLNVPFWKVGAIGAISVMSHWAGREMQQMYDALESGDKVRANAIERALAPSVDFESNPTFDDEQIDAPNPLPTKVMMGRLLGQSAVGECKSPMVLDDELRPLVEERALQVMEELETNMHAINGNS